LNSIQNGKVPLNKCRLQGENCQKEGYHLSNNSFYENVFFTFFLFFSFF